MWPIYKRIQCAYDIGYKHRSNRDLPIPRSRDSKIDNN